MSDSITRQGPLGWRLTRLVAEPSVMNVAGLEARPGVVG
jgi:hypothetical protein